MNQRQRSLRVLSKISENALPPKQKEECKLVDQNQLRPFLEDLMKRYDKLSMDLQAAQHKILEYSEQNYKLLTDNQQQANLLKQKDEEIAYLYQRVSTCQEKYEKQLDVLQGDNGKVVGMLTTKIDKLNAQLTYIFKQISEQTNEFEQTKSLLILSQQEVLEWRSRRALEESKTQKELNQVKQTLVQKEQELSALRIKYEFKQKTNQSDQQDSWRQELYIKSLAIAHQCGQCEILQNEVARINDIVIQLRGENENMRQELVDYEWLKRRFNVVRI